MSPPPNRPGGNPGNRPAGRPGTGRTANPGTARGTKPAPPPPENAPARTGAGDASGREPGGNRGLIGIGLTACGVGLALAGAGIAWAAWTRWDGIDQLKTAWSMELKNEESTRKQYAHRAAAELPTSAAAVLMDIDFSSDSTNERLNDLMTHADNRDRAVIFTAQALAGALKGQSPSQDVGPGDGEMLSILAALERGEPPHLLPTVLKGESHQSVANITLALQFQAALKAGDPQMISQAAGMLSLAMPAHPQAPIVAMISTLCDPHSKQSELDQAVNTVRDPNVVYGVLMNLIPIVPEHTELLQTLAFGGHIGDGPNMLEIQVNNCSRVASADLFDLAQRCLAANRADLATKLLPKLTQAENAVVSRQLSLASGDLAALNDTKKPDLRPRIATIVGRHHALVFQLSNDAGVIPASAITVMIGGTVIDKKRITQMGTLYSVAPENPPKAGDFEVEVHAADAVIFHGSVTL
jgi:hypothetical protein